MTRDAMTTDPGSRAAAGSPPHIKGSKLERHSWNNWLLLASVSLLTTVGLVTAIPPLLAEQVIDAWPWSKTELVLLGGVCLLMVVFVGYLTHQQREIHVMRHRLQLVHEQTSEHTQRHYQRILGLFDVSHLLGTENSLHAVFEGITSRCVESFHAEWASLMLLDHETDELVVKSATGSPRAIHLAGRRRKLGDGVAGWAARNRRALALGGNHDAGLYPGLKLEDPTITASMVVPIVVRDELVGVINVSTRDKTVRYDDEDLQTLEIFAENAGACIRHAEHIHWLRSMIQHFRDEALRTGREYGVSHAAKASSEHNDTSASTQGEFVI